VPFYQISFRLSEPCPVDLAGRNVKVGASLFSVRLDEEGAILRLEHIAAENVDEAEIRARDVANLLLNRLCALMQYCSELLPGFEYANLSEPQERGQVVTPGVAEGYLNSPTLPEEIELLPEQQGSAFFRAGNIARNPFEAFRNYYLAVDAIGKRIQGAGKDSTVVADTLRTVANEDMITVLAARLHDVTPPPNLRLSGDAVEDLNEVLYKGFRCALMHSGGSSDFVPFDAPDEQQVRSALRLMRGLAWQYVKYERDVRP
jgi:hypothetical protein